MKIIFTLFTIALLYFSTNAQILENWTTPIALTDSISDNSNPEVVVLQDNGVDELYMFYNKGLAPYRNIYWKKISEPMSEEQLLFGVWPEYDHRNPQILFDNFLVFEYNGPGNFDLFGIKIDATGIAGDLFRLTSTESDISSLFANKGYSSYTCCWESDGNVFVAEPQISQDTLILANIAMVDSGNCHDPVCQAYYIAWRKIENNESHIYYSEKNTISNQWSDPVAVIDTGNNFNLSLSIMPEFGGGDFLCWQATNRIYFMDLFGYNIYSPELPGITNYFEPAAFDFLLVTDYYYGFYSFAGEAEAQRDIYIADEYISNYVVNISDDPYLNKNPKLFAGRGNYNYYEVINIWQTEMNGHDVLFGTSARYNVVIGGINEIEMSNVLVFPNPVSKQATIRINLPEPTKEEVLISILNNRGQKVDEIRVYGTKNRELKIIWDKGDLPAGLYYLVLEIEHNLLYKKLVIL